MNQEKIGKFILENRKKRNITQAELAEKLGVTDRTISNWENGKNMPDLSLFKPLCEILDISINELISGEKIANEKYKEKLEENFINTINYVDKKNLRSNDKKSLFWLITGVFGIILSQLFLNNYEMNDYVSILFMILIIYSLKRLFVKYNWVRKLVAILLVIFCVLVLFLN